MAGCSILCIDGTASNVTHPLITLRPRQNGRYFANIFKCIFLNENVWISLEISLKFVPMVRISNIPALIQIMAWRRPGDKPLSESMMISLPTHIGVTRPQWVIQIKYGLPYCVPCPSMSTDPGSLNPGTRRSRVPGWWDPGIRKNTGAGDTVLAKHT